MQFGSRGPGGGRSTRCAGRLVAFQADNIVPAFQTGWSVLVQGWATVLTRPDDQARAHALALQSWAPGERWHFVRIHSEVISGRRLIPRIPLAAASAGAYRQDREAHDGRVRARAA